MIVKNELDGFYTLLIKNDEVYLTKNLCESTSTRRKQVQKIGIDKEAIGYLLEFVQNSNDVISFNGFLVTSNGFFGLAKSRKFAFHIRQFLGYKANYKELK